MTTLHLAQVHARFRTAAPLPAGAVQDWADALAAQDPAALLGSSLPAVADDEWLLVRRLPLQARWARDSASAEVQAQWGGALQQALAQALQQADSGGDDALHYRSRADAIADLLYRSALGCVRRQWAWAQMGLLPAAAARHPLPAAQALREGLHTLLHGQTPGRGAAADIWPVLARLAAAEHDCAALGAVLRAVPAADWRALLRASRRTSPFLAEVGDTAGAGAPRAASPSSSSTRPAVAASTPPAGAAADFAAWARARPELQASHGEVLAVLLAVLAWPGPPPSLGEGQRRRATAAAWLAPAGTAPRGPAWRPEGAGQGAAAAGAVGGDPAMARAGDGGDGRGGPRRAGEGAGIGGVGGVDAIHGATDRPAPSGPGQTPPAVGIHPSTRDGRAAPGPQAAAARSDGVGAEAARAGAPPTATTPAPRPEPATLPPLPSPAPVWQPTAWGGALFWLAQLPRSGLLAQPGAPMPAVPAGLLRALVRALGVPDDDPVADVFCAGATALQAPPQPDHTERAAAQVQHWADWLDRAAPDLPAPRLHAVCHRAGRLHVAPGWVELRLPLASVHTAVRRLGLDLDPGWLPWWGSVLVIRHDD